MYLPPRQLLDAALDRKGQLRVLIVPVFIYAHLSGYIFVIDIIYRGYSVCTRRIHISWFRTLTSMTGVYQHR